MREDTPFDVPGYILLKEIGRGGMGIVYLATPEGDPDCLRAIKILPRDDLIHEQDLRRFLREGKLGREFSHPNILPVYDLIGSENSWAIVMEYVDGGTLHRRLDLRVTMPSDVDDRAPTVSHQSHLRDHVELIADVADALEYAHRNGVTHRDVKPGNILIRAADDHPFLIDFGLARNRYSDSTAITSTGTMLGTPSYMAPEQVTDGKVDPRTDVYGLGATLFEIACGQPPFRAPSFEGLVSRIVHDDPPVPSRVAPHVPRELDTVILRAMEKKRDHRYPSAGAMRDDLLAILDGGRASAVFSVKARRFARATFRKRARVLGCLVLVVLAIAAFLYFQERQQAQAFGRLETRSLLVQARFEAERGQLEYALTRVDRAIERRPHDPEVHLHRALLLAASDRIEERDAALTRAEELGFVVREGDEATSTDLYLAALRRLALDDDEAAERLLERVTASNDPRSIPFLLLNQILTRRQSVTKARRALEQGRDRIRNQNQDDPIALALILQKEGRYEEATELLQRYVGKEPDGIAPSRLRFQLGYAYMWLREFEKAEQYLREAIVLDPQDLPARINLGLALIQLDRVRDAVSSVRYGLKRNPRMVGGYSVLGHAAYLVLPEDQAEARRLLAEALVESPTQDAAALLEAELVFRQAGDANNRGDHAVARARFETCLDKDPDHVGALTMLAQDDWASERFDSARAGFDQALAVWQEYDDLLDLGLKGWRSPQHRQRIRHAIQIGRFGLAADAETAGRALEGLEDVLVRLDDIDAGNALNLAEALVKTPFESYRDCRQAMQLVSRRNLRQHFRDDPAAIAILDFIHETCR